MIYDTKTLPNWQVFSLHLNKNLGISMHAHEIIVSKYTLPEYNLLYILLDRNICSCEIDHIAHICSNLVLNMSFRNFFRTSFTYKLHMPTCAQIFQEEHRFYKASSASCKGMLTYQFFTLYILSF